jgi:hypothetical protein
LARRYAPKRLQGAVSDFFRSLETAGFCDVKFLYVMNLQYFMAYPKLFFAPRERVCFSPGPASGNIAYDDAQITQINPEEE